MNSKQFISIIILIVLIGIIAINNNMAVLLVEDKSSMVSDCILPISQKTIRGDSLSGLIEAGQNINVSYGYYTCNEIKREDIILYDFSGNDVPIIKIIKGVPGDNFSVERNGSLWDVIINDKIVKNSENKAYILNEKNSKMLSMYVENYNGVIPQDSYLIFGNIITGSLDSTRFGLIHKNDILGYVMFDKH